MPVNIDIKQGSTWRRDKNGDRATRIAIISGVTGNIDQLLKNALDDAAMPNYGDAHPEDANITLQSITVSALSGTQYRAQMEYFNDPGSAATQATAGVRVSTSVAADETNHDINGDRLHFYTSVNTSSGFVFDTGVFTAEVQRPRITLDFEYTATAFPAAEIRQYNGKVNSAPWNGYPAKTMLCTIDADQEGDSYRVRFSFAQKVDGWQFYAAVKGSNLNLPASDHATKPDAQVDKFAAAKIFDVYEAVDFNALAFDLGLIYAEISGTAVAFPRINETDIVSGGKTLIITLYGGETWVAAGATFDTERQNIVDGLVSNKSEAAGWDASTNTICPVGNVVRTSDTVVTITFATDAGYVITESENVSVTIPASALVTSTTDLESITPYFTITGS